MAPAPGTRLGPYEIAGLLGAGGMGEVYRAHDPRLERDVALKLLPPEYAADAERRARFEREARAAAALNHPNICTIYEVGEVAPAGGAGSAGLYIAMELVDGATLRECLATGPTPMATGEVLDIGVQIADALSAAQKRHLVHRDLKSANIMLLPEGQVKVLDFGLAKRVVEETEETRKAQAGVTDAGVVVGTVAYMSPEQALGQEVDHRSDLFAFGVVLYELLTGRLPFTGRTSTALLDAVLHGEPAAEVGADLRGIKEALTVRGSGGAGLPLTCGAGPNGHPSNPSYDPARPAARCRERRRPARPPP